MVYREIRQSLIDMQNLFVLFEKKPVITEKIGAPNLIVSPTQSAIEFDNVTFGYTPEKTVNTVQSKLLCLFATSFCFEELAHPPYVNFTFYHIF